jgi:ATP-dependent protease Clp ATPase subunit
VSLKSRKSEYPSRGTIMSNIKRIFIIGHSGAGKGVLAQAVAKSLDGSLLMQTFLGVQLILGALRLKS